MISFDPFGGVARLIARLLESLPFIPPCKDAVVVSVTSGFQTIGGRSLFVDTIVWRCPDGRVITKSGPALFDEFGNVLPLPLPLLFGGPSNPSSESSNMFDTTAFGNCARARDAGILYPRSGHLLGHLGIASEDVCVQARLIEGADGSIAFVGIRTGCETDEVVSVTLSPNRLTAGELAAATGRPSPSYAIGLSELKLVADGIEDIFLGEADLSVRTVFDPATGEMNGAVVRLRTGDRHASLFLTDFKVGLDPTAAIVIIAIGFFVTIVLVVAINAGSRARMKAKIKVPNVDLDIDIGVQPGTAPITSGAGG